MHVGKGIKKNKLKIKIKKKKKPVDAVCGHNGVPVNQNRDDLQVLQPKRASRSWWAEDEEAQLGHLRAPVSR
jgi:hypothetical protein